MKLRFIILLIFSSWSFNLWALDLAPRGMAEDSTSDAITLRDSGSATQTFDEIKGTLFGRIRSTMIYNNYQQGETSYNYLDTTTDARLGYTVKTQTGDWMTSATIDFNIKSADSTVQARYLYVTLEDQQYSIRLGRQEPGGSTLGGQYLQNIDETLVIGETIGDGDYLTLRYKPAGLKLISGRHAARGDSSSEAIPNDEMAGAIFWEGGLGGHSFTASYTEIHERVNVVAQNELDATHGAENYIGTAAAWQIPMGPLHFSINRDRLEKKYLDNTQNPQSIDTTILFWDLKIDDANGITMAYSQETTDDGSPNLTRYTGGDIGFTHSYGILRFYAGINNGLTDDKDQEDPIKTSQFGIGIGAFFK